MSCYGFLCISFSNFPIWIFYWIFEIWASLKHMSITSVGFWTSFMDIGSHRTRAPFLISNGKGKQFVWQLYLLCFLELIIHFGTLTIIQSQFMSPEPIPSISVISNLAKISPTPFPAALILECSLTIQALICTESHKLPWSVVHHCFIYGNYLMQFKTAVKEVLMVTIEYNL